MAAKLKMGAMVLLVTILAVGAPSVSAHGRDLLQVNPFGNIGAAALTGQTVTLIDIPGLKITSRTEAPDGGINIGTLLGAGGPPTISITDRIEGSWMNPVTFTSTTELPTSLLSSLIPGGGGSSPLGFPGTSLAAADDSDDFDVDVPDVDIHSASTTVHASQGVFNFPGFNIPLPKLPFPFSLPAPKASPSPPPPRRHTVSSPPPPRRHDKSPPPPRSHKSSPADSPKSS